MQRGHPRGQHLLAFQHPGQTERRLDDSHIVNVPECIRPPYRVLFTHLEVTTRNTNLSPNLQTEISTQQPSTTTAVPQSEQSSSTSLQSHPQLLDRNQHSASTTASHQFATPHNAPGSTASHQTYAFISPETGISYTRSELDEWSRGKVNERGDTVFFKPGFVCEDPWFRLRDQTKK